MDLTKKENVAEIQEKHNANVLQPWSKQVDAPRRVIKDSKGVCFWDQNDKKYYDMASQLVYVNLGHKHPTMIEAISKLGSQELGASAFASEPKASLAAKIIEVAPKNMKKVYFTMAGAEANEHAIKIARMVTKRDKIFSRYRSYHGSTFGAGNLTGESRRFQTEPGINGFIKFPTPYPYRDDFNFETEEDYTNYYLTQLENQIKYEGANSIAALFVEPIPGSNGVILPPKGYLKGVEEICKRYQILFVCDEVMSGFGRTGKWFAVDNYDVQPDMITFAKGVTSGYLPLGGVIVSEEIAKFFETNILMTGSTYSGHALSCAVGNAAVSVYQDENLVDHAKLMEPIMNERLARLLDYKYVGDVRNIGLFGSVELVKNKETKEPIIDYGKDYGFDTQGYMGQFLQILTENGFHTYSHESCVFVSPPLIITEEEINVAMDAFEQSLKDFEEKYPALN